MSYELMIPDAADLPDYIIDHEAAAKVNADAIFGVSTGYAPRIKMSGKQFVLVDGDGVETPIPNGKLFKGPDDNLYLRVVVLRAKRELQKRFYLGKYDPNAPEHSAPDCFSNDGERPDSSIPSPQCETCAGCPQNAYGSGTNQDGNATAGKACSDNKMLAAFVPPLKQGESAPGTHELKITPASLKKWGMYAKALASRGISLGNIFTLISFADDSTFPVLTFQYGGAIPEASVSRLAAMAEAPETLEIVNSKITYSAKALPAPTDKKEQKAKKTTKKPSTKKPPVEAVPEKQTPTADDLGLGDGTVAAEAPSEVAEELGLTDEEILAEMDLGLD
jgi:hypothetical protein